MTTTRREFVKVIGGAAAAAGVVSSRMASAQAPAAAGITTLAFDAYGTLFDVFSVTELCEELFPGQGAPLTQLWRAKQLQYSTLRSLMGRHADFWQVTEDGLVYASKSLGLDLTADKRQQLMDAYLILTAFPDVRPGLEALKQAGVRVAIPVERRAEDAPGGGRERGDRSDSRRHHQHRGYRDLQAEAGGVRAHCQAPAGRPRRDGLRLVQLVDIAGAGSAGLTTFWIQRSATEPQEELGFPAAHIINAVTDLPALVGG